MASNPVRATIPFIDAVNICRMACPNEADCTDSLTGTAATPWRCARTSPTTIATLSIAKIPRPVNTTREDSPGRES